MALDQGTKQPITPSPGGNHGNKHPDFTFFSASDHLSMVLIDGNQPEARGQQCLLIQIIYRGGKGSEGFGRGNGRNPTPACTVSPPLQFIN